MKTTLKISGMHCTSCAFNIDDELEDLPGVKRAKTSYARGSIEVEYDSERVTPDALIEAIKRAGYLAV